MTTWLVAPPTDDRGERRRRVVTAALRAAYAMSARPTHPEGMREIARMTGVVMEAHGPGSGPVTPMALVDALRRPLGDLPIFANAEDGDGADVDDALRRVVLLEPDGEGGLRLSEAAHDLVCEHVVPLDEAAEHDWLPSWTWMSVDRIRERAFVAMTGPKDQHLYETTRRFLIEHPAGPEKKLQTAAVETGARMPPGGYTPIPEDALYGTRDGAFWWPCPECRWPMAVTREHVHCRYRPHSAVYRVIEPRRGKPPTLTRIDEGPRAGTPEAVSAEDARCVAQGIWRFVVVPGSSELRIAERLTGLGADVALWPELDAYDLHVAFGGAEFRLDVKEYRSPNRLIADLRARPPKAGVRVLLPRTHEHQAETVRQALPGLALLTEGQFLRQIKRIKDRERRRKKADGQKDENR